MPPDLNRGSPFRRSFDPCPLWISPSRKTTSLWACNPLIFDSAPYNRGSCVQLTWTSICCHIRAWSVSLVTLILVPLRFTFLSVRHFSSVNRSFWRSVHYQILQRQVALNALSKPGNSAISDIFNCIRFFLSKISWLSFYHYSKIGIVCRNHSSLWRYWLVFYFTGIYPGWLSKNVRTGQRIVCR